jgi:hypothetical protein
LKQDRDRALKRAKEGARQPIEITAALIEKLGCMMREKLTGGDIAFRKTYISAIVDRVEVDDGQIRIIGRKEILEQAVRASAAVGPGVRSFVPKWRPSLNITANPYVIEISL